MVEGSRFRPAPARPITVLAHVLDHRSDHPSSVQCMQADCGLTSDGFGDDYFYCRGQDDAHGFMQPAMSPLATRLTSPNTPAIEKAAAMERLSDRGLFDVAEKEPDSSLESPEPFETHHPSQPHSSDAEEASAGNLSKKRWRDAHLSSGQVPTTNTSLGTEIPTTIQPPAPKLPSPWVSGPRLLVLGEASKSAMSSVLGGPAGHRRSQTAGENALKRLSKAFPTISIPAGLIPSIPTPASLFSSSSQREERVSVSPNPESVITSPTPTCTPSGSTTPLQNGHVEAIKYRSFPVPRSAPVAPRKSYMVRRSTSAESLLYTTLTRVSSIDQNDEERFAHITGQVNARLKAIKDSWDGPSFKLPQLPNLLNTPLKWNPDAAPGVPGAGVGKTRQYETKTGSLGIDAILESLTGDIVVMGGYRGSVLRSAQPPYRQLWVPVKVGLNMRKVNLEVGLDPEDEESMEEHIKPSGMLQHIGPVDISRRLFRKLRDCENARKGLLRVHDYGYDWRLSPHLLSRKLIDFLTSLPSNQAGTPAEKRGALVISHSLGGLITRHAVNQRPELFSGVIYAGTPNRCINILGPLRNGDAVLLNEKVLTAQVTFSLRTTFVFLPEDGFCFIDKTTGEEYPLDFYNADEWVKNRLCPCVGKPAFQPLTRCSSSLTSLLSFPDLPMRTRSQYLVKRLNSPECAVPKDRTLAPQISSFSSASDGRNKNPTPPSSQARHLDYLRRVLGETKRFRAELAYDEANRDLYPPFAVIYARDIPTVYAARVAGRENIASTEAYDDLVFRGGDGVVLAKESMLPPGYDYVRGGRVRTDRGHISLLGDMVAMGKAIEAVVRGRRKGIGLRARKEP